jgi:hypothetical protein
MRILYIYISIFESNQATFFIKKYLRKEKYIAKLRTLLNDQPNQ